MRTVVLAVSLAALVLAAAIPAPAIAKLKVGAPAPSFTLTTRDHRKVRLEDLRGKVVIVNYWATWCGPCKREMPLLSVFARKLKDKGLEVYSITVDDPPKKVLDDVGSALAYPLATSLHGNGYGILEGVPTNFVIDRNGTLRYAKANALDLDQMNELIIPLLNEAGPAN